MTQKTDWAPGENQGDRHRTDHIENATKVNRLSDPSQTVDTLTGMVVIHPTGDTVNGIIVKAPSNSWDDSDGYGSGQALIVLNSESSGTTQERTQFRVDGTGGVGMNSAHIVTGANGRGTSATQALWIDPGTDATGIAINNPDTTEVASATADFLKITDIRGGSYNVLRVKADGTLATFKSITATGRTTTDSPLVITRVASATVPEFRMYDSDGTTPLLGVKQGYLWSRNGLAVGSGSEIYSSAAALWVYPVSASDVGAYIRGLASQTGNLLHVVDSSNALLGRISAGGYFITKKNAAPADSVLAAGELAFWFDSTNGAAKAMFKAKQADGTVRTGSVSLA